MTRKIASWVVNHRYIVGGIVLLITIFFAFEARMLVVKTVPSDLLPTNHAFMKTHEKYKGLTGGSFKVFLMLQVKEGNIYNKETLEKITRITNGLDAIPGVNHNQIYSIASRKLKNIKIVGDAVIADKLMKHGPFSPSYIKELKEAIRTTPGIFGVWVSKDEKSVFFSAALIEHLIDCKATFKKVSRLVEKESDKNHTIFMAGEPILMGWVNHYQGEMWWIFGFTILLLFGLLYLYFRNLVGVLVPIISTSMAAIWGLGFCGMIGWGLDPLILVIPLLITARALSHTVQLTERYFECYQECKDVKEACIGALASILSPGILGIVTDAAGILFIAVAPIPLIHKLAYVCSFWAFSIIFTTIIFAPLALSFFAPPANIPEIVDTERGWISKLLGIIAMVGFGRSAVVALVLGIILIVFTGVQATKVEIGDIHPGSPLFWEDSNYNIAVDAMNKNFPGTDELYVFVEGDGPTSVESPGFLRILNSFQRYMEKSSLTARTQSVYDLLPSVYRIIYGGHPKWETIPLEKKQSVQIFYRLESNSAPGDFDLYFSRNKDVANVVIWYKNHMGKTLRESIARVKKFVEENKEMLAKEKCTFRLASGTLGMIAATNEAVVDSQLLNMILVLGMVFILCSLAYQSFVAALILMVPLNFANIVTLSVMRGLDIGLNINTLPIVSVGVGVGIDYGIYLLSRLCEEFQAAGGEYSLAVASQAIKTSGKAIFFTATTMVIAVLIWYFLSSMKFQAEMGLLLSIIMFINMVGALVLIPALLYVFKPKFLGRAKLLV